MGEYTEEQISHELAARAKRARIADLEHQLEAAQRDYLKHMGWTSTSHTPGSYWLWVRDFADYGRRFDEWHAKNPDRKREPYGTFTAQTELALRMSGVLHLDMEGDCD
jgi:hypothetical protein